MYNFELRQNYSFDVYPVALLGTAFKNVTVMAILDPETANQQIDIFALHAQVYPTLPAGTPNKPTDYNYVKLRLANGSTTVLGLPWIKEDTVQQITASVIKATISNVSPSDVTKVRNCLVQNGFSAIEISVDGVVVAS